MKSVILGLLIFETKINMIVFKWKFVIDVKLKFVASVCNMKRYY